MAARDDKPASGRRTGATHGPGRDGPEGPVEGGGGGRPRGARPARDSGRRLWQRAQRGWPASFPLAQFPNPPLIVALAALLLSALTTGDLSNYARATYYATLATWAWLELTDPANWFRRLLGAAGLVYVVAAVASVLGA